MSVIHDLRRKIRDFIQHPRRLNPLLGDYPNWNVLASCFDTVADTEMAIQTYEAMADPRDHGMHYLTIYGLLQCLYVQQDAVESMVRAFEPSATQRYQIESEPEAVVVRQIRNNAIGHPTKVGDVNSKKSPGVQKSFTILQHSLHKDGFQLVASFANRNRTLSDVKIPHLIQLNRCMVERVLTRIKEKLEAAEMEHRKTFKGEPLSDLFPETLGYFFEKVFAGADSPTSPNGQYGEIHLQVIADKVRMFREALQKRGLLNPLSNWEYDLDEVEYPLGELRSYWTGTGSLKEPRAAKIFVSFVQDRVSKLREAATEIDEEYHEELGIIESSDQPGQG